MHVLLHTSISFTDLCLISFSHTVSLSHISSTYITFTFTSIIWLQNIKSQAIYMYINQSMITCMYLSQISFKYLCQYFFHKFLSYILSNISFTCFFSHMADILLTGLKTSNKKLINFTYLSHISYLFYIYMYKFDSHFSFCHRFLSLFFHINTSLFQITKYPKETAVALYETSLEYVSKEGLDFVMKMIPSNQIYLLSVFFIYSFISAALIFQVVPLVIFYLTLSVMGVTTLQMFYKKKKLNEASKLANILKTYDVGVDVEQTKSQFTWNSLAPYLVFFGALPLLVVSFSISNKSYIPCSEICVLCGVLSAICFVALSDSYDLLTLLSLFCNFLSALPTFFHHFPQIPFLTKMLHIFTDALFTIPCGSGFQIHVGIPSIAYLLIPLVFIIMAAQKSWKGVYRVLVPHLVCYFWFNLMLSFFPFSTWKGLIRGTLGYFFLPFLIPMALLLTLGGLIYGFYCLLQTQIFGKLFITLIFAAVPLLLTQTKVLIGKKMDSKLKSVKVIIMVIFGILALLPLIFIRLPSAKSPKSFNLTYAEYHDFCGSTGLPKSLRCLHLQGQKVTWKGKYSRSEIKSVTNNIEPLLAAFPGFIANEIRCLYGQKFGKCNDPEKTESEQKLCAMMDDLGHECHLRNLDTYTFEVYIILEYQGFIFAELDAGHSFKETLVALKESDEVEFTATLVKDLGTRQPKLILRQITCTSRALDVMARLEEESVEEILMRELNNAIMVTFNFFWYPLVEYAP